MVRLRWLAMFGVTWFAVMGVASGQESYGSLVDANTKFAFKFFQQNIANDHDHNVLIAPTALSLDFALLQNGANAAAKAAIFEAFSFRNLSTEQINRQSDMLRQALSYFQPQLPKGQKKRRMRKQVSD